MDRETYENYLKIRKNIENNLLKKQIMSYDRWKLSSPDEKDMVRMPISYAIYTLLALVINY